jgi:hypothetical protein
MIIIAVVINKNNMLLPCHVKIIYVKVDNNYNMNNNINKNYYYYYYSSNNLYNNNTSMQQLLMCKN